jgi:hypothetical protein
LLVAPVVAGGVNVVDGQDFPGPQFDDGDGGRSGDGEDCLACVSGADADVVHASSVADGDLAAFVDVVVAQPVIVSSCAGPVTIAWNLERARLRPGRRPAVPLTPSWPNEC